MDLSRLRPLVLAALAALVCSLTAPAFASGPASGTEAGGDAPTAASSAARQAAPSVATLTKRLAKAKKVRKTRCTAARKAKRRGASAKRVNRTAKRCAQAKRKVRTAKKRLRQAKQKQKQQAKAPKPAPKPVPKKRSGFREYVSLGDSWTADVVILDTNGLPSTKDVPIDCAQSQVNYPKLVAAELGIPVHRDPSCGSATTDHFSGPQSGLPLGGTNAPQYDRLTPTTDLVTIGIGGNDAGFAGNAMSCLNLLPLDLTDMILPTLPALPFGIPLLGDKLPVGGCVDRFVVDGVDELADRIDAAKPKLVTAIREVRRRSPQARILMLDYISAIPEKACPLNLLLPVPISQRDITYLRATFERLNAMVRAAAAEGGAELVETYLPTLNDPIQRDVCGAPHQRYVEGLGVVSVNGLAVAIPAHPNSAGAAAQAELVIDHIRNK